MTYHRRVNLYYAAVAAILMLAAWVAYSQTAAAPTLSTADKVAIQTFEKSKQDAQKEFDSAQQGELTVLREWGNAHPGWHVDQRNFAVVKDDQPVNRSSPGAALKPPADKPVEPKKP
jgi:hypothetical protein